MGEKVAKDRLKEKTQNREYESAIMLVERVVETDEMIKKPDGTEEPQKVSRIDVVVLLDEFKDDSERINELAREVAKMNGRNIVAYEDAEEAIKLVKVQKSVFLKKK